MSVRSRSRSWLFSFVDLSFLLLIAVTQLGGVGAPVVVEFGEIAIPQIRTADAIPVASGSERRWQVRVYAAVEGMHPFSLVEGPGAAPAPDRLSVDDLADQLARLRRAPARKPLLAPHEDARAGDLLTAAVLLQEQWPSRSRATIAPVGAGPPLE